MEGKWLIGDRDSNEREGLKWLLKTTSVPITHIHVASNFQELILQFEKETPDVLVLELDMLSNDQWHSLKELVMIYEPILILTSAEATFEKASLAIEIQALELMIKPLSSSKLKTVYKKASRLLTARNQTETNSNSYATREGLYELLFLPNRMSIEDYYIAVFQTETKEMIPTLHAFLIEFPFQSYQSIFVLSDMVVILFKQTSPRPSEQCQKAMHKWEEEYSDAISIAVHIGKGTSPSIHHKYLEVRKMLELTYYRGYRQVIQLQSSPAWAHIDSFLTPPEQRRWIEMLANHELQNIKEWLYAEFVSLTEPYPEPGLVRIRLTSILAQMRRFMKTNGLEKKTELEAEYRYIFNSILYDAVLYRTVQNLILFAQKLFLKVAAGNRNYHNDPIEKGISFLEKNFRKRDLKLVDVANHVNRSPSYFSYLLQQKTGQSFTEIVSSIRINEAKRLLSESDQPVKEIALSIGYPNPNYFSRVFRELVGVTPREFRTGIVK
ncbi:helix-turn-helix domain-containing protein [Peribacillus acanthi]|uniref:helix-turn-helix domain-containing protein n=1 Tax=Peribacillus acanthi TaxID=2171554 RepID=UPI000D3E02DF|nr:helix-turn-helix domain-containing protein [Peribacillus acanthi]